MDSMMEHYLRLQGWSKPPHVHSPVLDAALRGLVVPDRVRGDAYTEIERRLLGYHSPLEQGIDIHNQLAKLLFDGPPKDGEEAKARRHAAQAVNFTRLYGGDPAKHLRGLAKV
jgi:hypothetical protein